MADSQVALKALKSIVQTSRKLPTQTGGTSRTQQREVGVDACTCTDE